MAELFDNPVDAVIGLDPIDPNKNYLEELVGEGKPYKDPTALARATAEKERHIKRLETEAKALRNDLNSRVSIEQLIDKMATSANRPAPPIVPNEVDGTTPAAGTDTSTKLTLTPEDLAKLVDERLAAATQKSVAKSNMDFVKTTLKTSWGDQWVTKLKEEGAKLGLNEEWMNSLAAAQPKALLALVGTEVNQQSTRVDSGAPMRSSINIQSAQPDPNFKGKTYYNKLRRDNPTQFWSERTQIEMNNMAMKDPEKYLAS